MLWNVQVEYFSCASSTFCEATHPVLLCKSMSYRPTERNGSHLLGGRATSLQFHFITAAKCEVTFSNVYFVD